MNNSIRKRILLLGMLVLCSTVQVFAGGTTTYVAKVTATLTPTGSGTVYVGTSQNPNNSDNAEQSTTSSGETVTLYLNAVPETGYVFEKWSFKNGSGTFGNAENAATSVEVNASKTKAQQNNHNAKNYTVQATFRELPKFYYNAVVHSTTGGSASVDANPSLGSVYGVNLSSTSASKTVKYTATAANGYVFKGWAESATGTPVSTDNPMNVTFNMTTSHNSEQKALKKEYWAIFKERTKFYYAATATADPAAGGSVTVDKASGSIDGTDEDDSKTVQITFTATPNTGYIFVRWEDASGNTLSTDATYKPTLTVTSTNGSSPTRFDYKAIFQELPKFYYTIRYAIHTDYADGSKSSGDGGTVTQSSTGTKMVYGTTLDATSATVSASGITLTATAKNGFSFTNWTRGGTVASTSNQYSPGNLTVTSKTESSPTVFTFTANFNEFPIFYAKLNMEIHEYLASTHEYSTENKGSSAKFSDDVILEDGYLVIHATSASQTSASQNISVEALEGEGFGFRGWSTTEVPAKNIGTASYASNARIYTMPVTTSSKTKSDADLNPIPVHAYFEEFPIFYFDVKTQVIPMSAEAGGEQNPGTASVNPAGIQEFYASSLTATEGTASATFSATAKTGYKFGGWYRKNADGTYTEVSKYNPYSARLKSSSKDINNPTETTMYAQFLVSMLTISAQDIELDTESDGWLEITVTPKDAWKSYIITSDKPSLVYVDNSGHCRTNLIPGTTQIHIQGVTTDGQTPDELYTTVNAKVRIKCRMPLISFSPSDDGTKAMLTLTRAADDAKDGTRLTTLYYTTDDPSGSGVTWHKYEGNPVAVDPDATVYAKSKMLKADGSVDSDYTESNIARADYVKPQVETPSVLIDKDGITFTTSTPGTITYYYTVNDAIGGTDPTTTSYTGTWTTGSAKITGIDSEKYIRVIATRLGYEQSPVGEGQNIMSSGINGNTVILNDYEDHNWTYYAGVDPSIDGGNYNTNYKNIMYSKRCT